MSAFDSLKKFIGIEEIDEEEITADEVQEAKEKLMRETPRESAYSNRRSSSDGASSSSSSVKAVPIERRISVASTNAFKLVLIEPKSFDECPKLVDALKGRRPIIINLEKIETESAKKIFDFLSGATYALNGSVQKVANNIFIFAPESVDIAANQEDRAGFDFGGNKSPWR
ncbi:MAG: cell division protein SepF [Firmicutes bacterium]|jgi:cell division inhibitor SepF|nr:cell division protein SepF [Bacillota bacterium]